MKASEGEPAKGPLIFYVIDDSFELLKKNKELQSHLQVFVSTSNEFPSSDNFDYSFDFRNETSNLHQMKIFPQNQQPFFSYQETFLYFGFYSLKQLPNFAFLYTFSLKYEFTAKKMILNYFCDDVEAVVQPEQQFPAFKNYNEIITDRRPRDFRSSTNHEIRSIVDKPDSDKTHFFLNGWKE